jgi:hypothetical protein
MDILSHGLWAAVATSAAGRKLERRFDLRKAFFWGVFPDLFAFAIPFIWLVVSVVATDMTFADFPRPRGGEPPPLQDHAIYGLSPHLYDYSHSLVVFAAVALIVWAIQRRRGKTSFEAVPWILIGWPLHILMDVPTHSYRFYPTPVFWPLSGWKFDGFSWGVWWFMLLNYSSLTAAFLFLRLRRPSPKT